MRGYSDKKEANKRQRIFRIKIYFACFFAALLALAIFYLLVCSPVFKVKRIAIENNRYLPEDEIIRELRPVVLSTGFGGLAGFDNMFSWPDGKVSGVDNLVSGFEVSKNWFRMSITVRVNERERFAIWCVTGGKNCYWLDKNGIVFEEAPLTEGSLVFTVFDSRETELFPGSRVEEERFSANLISILDKLGETGLTAKKINFDGSKQELSVQTEEGPALIFGLRYDSAKNIPLIKNLDYKNAKYIDLSVENRIFMPAK